MMGNSVINTASKIVSALTPFFIYDIYYFTGYGMFLIMAGVILSTFIIMKTFPVDQTGKELDIKEVIFQHDIEEFDKLLVKNNKIY